MKQMYKIEQSEENLVIDSDSCCPMSGLRFIIRVLSDAQHDGHLWSNDYINDCEEELANDIMEDLEKAVKSWIKDIKPFRCHQEFDAPSSI